MCWAVSATGGDPTLHHEYSMGPSATSLHPGTHTSWSASLISGLLQCIYTHLLQPWLLSCSRPRLQSWLQRSALNRHMSLQKPIAQSHWLKSWTCHRNTFPHTGLKLLRVWQTFPAILVVCVALCSVGGWGTHHIWTQVACMIHRASGIHIHVSQPDYSNTCDKEQGKSIVYPFVWVQVGFIVASWVHQSLYASLVPLPLDCHEKREQNWHKICTKQCLHWKEKWQDTKNSCLMHSKVAENNDVQQKWHFSSTLLRISRNPKT